MSGLGLSLGSGRRSVAGYPPLVPSTVSAVSAWLQVANATLVSGEVSSVPDALNSNPATQATAARSPTAENSANGLPCMRFATNDVLVWPITAQSSASDYAGWGFWFKLNAASASSRLIRVATGTNAASALKLTMSTASGNISGGAVSTNTVTKSGGTLTTAWVFATVEYDKDGVTDNAKQTLTLNGISVGSLAGSTLAGALASATGNILIGNGNDGTASAQLDGLIGPNIYAFGSKMAGATVGLLTTAARFGLMNYQAPT